ncbi:DUF3967 domain-containing protein [Alicyclobacillus fastidiosus]|uniref:DUF3967 domain-containing protein n=1 Tax=Alicyclobacillus fastidiosus TaxID=392011 RepID=A0ABV5ALM7_9BACL
MNGQDGVEITEASKILNLKVEAIRKRLQRGQLKGYKIDNRWYVVLEQQDNMSKTEQDNVQDEKEDVQSNSELVDTLKSEIEFLRGELAARTEENRRKDHIIAALSQRIPQLPEGPQNNEQDIVQRVKNEVAATIQNQLEERDKKLMETLRAIQEEKTKESSKKRSWFRWGK